MTALYKKKPNKQNQRKSINTWLCNSQGFPTCSAYGAAAGSWQGIKGACRGGSAPTTARSAVASPVPPATAWLCQSSLAPLDLLRSGACCSLASFELNFGEQIPHQLRRIRVWWDCTVCGGSFLAMAGEVVGVGQLPLITDRDITTGHQPSGIHVSCSLSSIYD